jgi:penicillin-binding protein 2
MQPYVVKRIEDPTGRVVHEPAPKVLHSVKLPEAALRAVQRSMEAVVNEPGGTAWSSRLEKVRYAGKTGTSQVVKLKDDADRGKQSELIQHRDHALFIAYAPADKPQLAVAVVVEHGGHGGSVAAPIARAMFASYFGLESSAEGPDAREAGPEVPVAGPEVSVEGLEAPIAPADSGD